ncbi:MAG: monovalent cation/H(+) antiporter subunit G [Chloroflexi bacterium]|nr:monovalent cation/H(+) antiporter subunit G [Chloroflexota bacterium]
MTILLELLTVALLVVGGMLMLLAAIGVVRMPDVYSRMQSSTKASSLGVGCVLGAVAIVFGDLAIAVRVVLIVAFIFMTAPVSAHMIGRAAYFVGVPLWEGTRFDELREHNEGAGRSNRDVSSDHPRT